MEESESGSEPGCARWARYPRRTATMTTSPTTSRGPRARRPRAMDSLAGSAAAVVARHPAG